MNGEITIPQTVPKENTTGWIVLSFVLATALILFILLWVFSVHSNQNSQQSSCFGPYGVETGFDGDAINQCGTDQSTPCVFAKNSIADCEAECETLKSICSAFTFNDSTSTMKIVKPTNVFASSSSNLFVRQQ
jgi:hypothetical protein